MKDSFVFFQKIKTVSCYQKEETGIFSPAWVLAERKAIVAVFGLEMLSIQTSNQIPVQLPWQVL